MPRWQKGWGGLQRPSAGYFGEYLRQRHITDPVRWVDPEQIASIERAIAAGADRLKLIREFLEGSSDYETIRIVATCWQNRNGREESTSPLRERDSLSSELPQAGEGRGESWGTICHLSSPSP
ncbi:MAG: hypothetical protein R3B91_20805 [Planctomycetaceae bacterium]